MTGILKPDESGWLFDSIDWELTTQGREYWFEFAAGKRHADVDFLNNLISIRESQDRQVIIERANLNRLIKAMQIRLGMINAAPSKRQYVGRSFDVGDKIGSLAIVEKRATTNGERWIVDCACGVRFSESRGKIIYNRRSCGCGINKGNSAVAPKKETAESTRPPIPESTTPGGVRWP